MASCALPSHWDERFMAMAQLVASWSKDPRKRVGSVLVSPDCRHVAWGYNGPPAGFDDEVLAIMDRAAKNKYSLHAEDNAIANAATDVRGWTMYSSFPPCLPCALSIHRAGIARVVAPAIDRSSCWAAELDEARAFLSMMGVVQC